jgi:SAM-dependent methyltransferase
VLTTRDAARLLSSVRTPADLASLTSALGFRAPLPLDRKTARRLGIHDGEGAAALAIGQGSVRALIARVNGQAAERTVELSRTLAREAPERWWMVLVLATDGGAVCLAAAPSDGRDAVPLLAVDPRAVRESDAETFAALAGVGPGPDAMVHLRWRETLGRTAITGRFYRELEACVHTMATTAVGDAPAAARRTMALLHTSRLLFVAFLEARGWLDGDREFLRRHLAARTDNRTGHGAHRRFLEPLWFGTLNTPFARRAPAARQFGRVPFLNGGLFMRSRVEARWRRLQFTDDAIAEVVGGLLARYRLTARESSHEWSDAAVDPEMLGRAFESLMQERTRRARGAYYTPPPLIARLTREGLLAALGLEAPPTDLAPLEAVRVLDPACGSGAFLVFALEELAAWRAAAGDARPTAERRRLVLSRAIFGVDVDPMAVWLCQLRLWLSVVVDEEPGDGALTPLPNLDRNIREGDALAGAGFGESRLPASAAVATLRLRYVRAVGQRKRTLGRALDRHERTRAMATLEARIAACNAQRRELLASARSPDLFRTSRGADSGTRSLLRALREDVRRARDAHSALRQGGALPFAWATHFPEAHAAGGFSMVVGNPPWVRTHGIPREQRESLRERFTVFRTAAWESGAAAAAAGRGFAAQVDLAALFVERAVRLTAPGGAVALLLPAKLWGSLAGGGVRAFLETHAPVRSLEDHGDSSAGFDAVVYPSALVARRQRNGARDGSVRATVHRRGHALTWDLPREQLALDATSGAPWLLLPPEVRSAFDRLSAAGVPLVNSVFGRPILGVKSGCNEAFVLDHAAAAAVEPRLVRPVLRGEHLRPWRASAEGRDVCLLWTHDARGAPLAELPAGARRHLGPWRAALERRSDARGDRWWALFRPEAARHDRPRVVWADIGRTPRALVLPAGDRTVPLNSCYVVRAPTEPDAVAFAALLNSPVGAAWLGVLAEPARGGYRRYLGWTCARYPVPARWERARALLEPLGRAAMRGDEPDRWTLTEAVLEAYGLTHRALSPLLSWQGL